MSDAAPAMPRPEVGVIGGSGLYALFDEVGPTDGAGPSGGAGSSGDTGSVTTLDVATPYGPPSAPVTIGTIGGRRVAFLPRHGARHTFAPARIPYRANAWALASLGVRALVTSSAVGGLRADLAPGTFVVTDQLVDRTTGRDGTFFDEGPVAHLAAPDPFDPRLRALAVAALEAQGVPVRPRGTAVVIPGPRFATRAESRWYAAAGGDTINMTLAPETPLALELGLGVVNISFVTDSDSAVERDHADAVSADLVLRRLAAAQPVIRRAIDAVVQRIPPGFAAEPGVPRAASAEVLARPVAR